MLENGVSMNFKTISLASSSSKSWPKAMQLASLWALEDIASEVVLILAQ